MITTLKKLNYRTAVVLGIIFYSLTIAVHILILSGIIPLEWINGGRSLSIENQLPLSMFNLVISVFGIGFLVYANNHQRKKGVVLTSRILSGLWFFGFAQQLFGTPFEKFVMSLILLLGLISHLRIGLDK